ncbi:MAG: hypothetical protein DI527_19335 [Chelatococcus sp.]|nr:MAG: hypothetical protein DI527_19335 [Chelatococcus sp.]
MTMHAEAGLTIAMRMPLLMQGALGNARGQREATRAVTEKVSATLESTLAAGHAATMFWLELAFAPLTSFDAAEAAAKAANSTLEPFSKRVSANAARLTGRRAR